jgi:geranylgeranyl diphosphate synthase type I
MADDVLVDLAAVFARYRPEIEASLRNCVPRETAAPGLYDLLRYHLGWLDENLAPTQTRSGKMLRPIICLLSCEAVGGDFRRGLPAAAALELLHNFSLIHDDVEDRGRERHGRATVWANWGEPLAVNAGDAMLILSELSLLQSSSSGLGAEVTLTMLGLLNDCCLRLTEGQHLDMTLEGNPDLTESQYFRIIAGKTAALLGCSAQLGAMAGLAQPERAESFRRFGENLGIGFQIQDDVLGIWGDRRETGKPAAADVYGRKVTLPVIEALRRAPATVRARIADVYRTSTPTAADVAEVVGYLDALGARDHAEAAATAHVERARRDLDQASPLAGPGAELWALARSLIGRKA